MLRELRRQEYAAEAAKLKTNPPKLPEGQYNVIVADPPWPTGEPGRTQGSGGEAGVFVKDSSGMKYSTLSLSEIAAQFGELIKRAGAPDCRKAAHRLHLDSTGGGHDQARLPRI